MRSKSIVKGSLLALCGLAVAGPALADPPLDGDFAEWGLFFSGKTIVQFNTPETGLTDTAADSVVGPDGSMYLVGTVATPQGNRFGVAKLDSEGGLDLDFSTDGKNTSLEVNVTATSVALSGNFLLVAGYKHVDQNNRDFIVCRFNATNGVNINFPAPVNSPCVKPEWFAVGRDEANDIAVQSDGKFVIGGTVDVGTSSYAGFARFEANGEPDLGFGDIQGSNMMIVRNENIFSQHNIKGIAIASNGKIIGIGDTKLVNDDQVAGLMVRLNPDGTQDELGPQDEFAFYIANNGGGTWMNDVVAVDDPGSVDDALVAVGFRDVQGGNVGGVITKIASNGGTLVSSFGNSDGETTISIQGDLIFNRLAVQPGTGFVVIGGRPGDDVLDIEVRRFKYNGLPDTSFGNGGNVVIDMGLAGQLDLPAGVSVDKDGVYFSGYSYIGASDYDFVAGKLLLDRIFANGFEIF